MLFPTLILLIFLYGTNAFKNGVFRSTVVHKKLTTNTRLLLPDRIQLDTTNEDIIRTTFLQSSSAVDVTNDVPAPPPPSILWRGVVLFICIVWSTNFVVLKEIYQAAPTLDPSLYAAIRFSLAALALLPRTFNSIGNKDLILGSATIGLSVFFGYFGQSIGLQTTDAGKSAFICSLNVVWVALVSSILKKQFKPQTWISALLAVTGVALLETNEGHELTSGDLWCFMQPIGFGSGYVLLEYLIGKFPQNAGAVTGFKLMACALASITWAGLSGHTLADVQPILDTPVALYGLLYMGFITSAAMLWLQSYAFKNVPATDVSIILTFEPISATIFASILLGEALTRQDILGGALIVFACISNELNLYERLFNRQTAVEGKEKQS